jgi:hypothetical protein
MVYDDEACCYVQEAGGAVSGKLSASLSGSMNGEYIPIVSLFQRFPTFKSTVPTPQESRTQS